jgi:hypothetical protein
MDPNVVQINAVHIIIPYSNNIHFHIILPPTEARDLLGCTAVFLIECRLTSQRYMLPPSSGQFYTTYI